MAEVLDGHKVEITKGEKSRTGELSWLRPNFLLYIMSLFAFHFFLYTTRCCCKVIEKERHRKRVTHSRRRGGGRRNSLLQCESRHFGQGGDCTLSWIVPISKLQLQMDPVYYRKLALEWWEIDERFEWQSQPHKGTCMSPPASGKE